MYLEYVKGGINMLSKDELQDLPETMKYGILVNKRDYNKQKVDILLKKLYTQNESIMLLRSLLDSDEKLIEVLDIMAGLSIKFPTHTTILKYINEIDIWSSLKHQGPTDANIKAASVNYKIPATKIKTIYENYENEFGDDVIE